MKKNIIFFMLAILISGCSSTLAQRGALSKAYSSYDDGNYEDVLALTSRAENYEEPSREMKAEIVFLKALALEKLEKQDEALGLYKYLSEQFGDTQYGYKAKEKIKGSPIK